jgi:hypothetical protein
MKKGFLIDIIFIVILAVVLVIINELSIPIKIGFLFIPFLICYYIGRYATTFKFNRNK